jgi:RHS repeat-associated protein
LRSDANKGITLIEYNYLKKPKKIVQNGVTTLFEYDANGTKLKETIGTQVTQYLGNIIYKANVLYQIGHEEGRINSQFQYEFNITDHLGNLRVAFKDVGGVATIVQKQDYGVWGEDLTTLNYSSTTTINQFKFTGKEELSGTGYIDFGARLYDNLVPRFLQLDANGEKYNSWTPYNYAFNNPVR